MFSVNNQLIIVIIINYIHDQLFQRMCVIKLSIFEVEIVTKCI